MKKNGLVSIVIANYNGEKYLNTCLKSVINSGYKNIEIVLTDDASKDRSVDIINGYKKKDKRITLIKNKSNLGAAASRNRAIKKVRGDVIVFLDNDTEVNPGWLTELLKQLEIHNVGAAQSLLLDFEKRDRIQMAGGRLIPQTGWLAADFVELNYSKNKSKLTNKNIVGISASLAVKKEVLGVIGSFDEKEAVTTEDLDFCWRVWIAGYRIVLAKDSVVYHFSKTVKDRSYISSKNNIYFHLAKNSFRSIIKNYEKSNLFKYLLMSALINIFRSFYILIIRRDSSALKGFVKSVIWIIDNLNDTLKNRFDVQRTRKYSDKHLMSQVFTTEDIFTIYNNYFKLKA